MTYPRERLWTDCEAELTQLRADLDALQTMLAPVVAAVVLSPLTDDDERQEIQRRWAALHTDRAAGALTEE